MAHYSNALPDFNRQAFSDEMRGRGVKNAIVVQAFSDRELIDSNKSFVEHANVVLTRMCSPGEIGSIRFRRLLLGRKDTSELLKQMQDAAKAATPNGKLLTCYIDYSKEGAADKPLLWHIIGVLPTHVAFRFRFYEFVGWYESELQRLEKVLVEFGYVMFIAIDELQSVYGANTGYGQQIVEQLFHIGGMEGRALVAMAHHSIALPDFNEQAFFDHVNRKLFLDDSRRSFVNDAQTVLAGMCSPGGYPPNRFRRLLLGRKGMGKSTLLTKMQEAAKAATPNGKLLTCYIDFSVSGGAKALLSHIIGVLPEHVAIRLRFYELAGWYKSEMQRLEEVLVEFGYVMFLAIDELQMVYGANVPNGRQIIRELHQIGGMNGRAIHCIMTGTCKRLRELAFCKLLPDCDKSDYPNYDIAYDLNSTKYAPQWIYPLVQSVDDIKGAVRLILDTKSDMPDTKLLDCFEKTWGNIGHMEACLRNSEPDGYSMTSRNVQGMGMRFHDFLVSLCDVVSLNSDVRGFLNGTVDDNPNAASETVDDRQNGASETIDDSQNAASETNPEDTAAKAKLIWYTKLTCLVTVGLVNEQMKRNSTPNQDLLDDADLFRLADGGYIRYEPHGIRKMVGFANPCLYLEAMAERSSLSPGDLAALVIFGDPGAERVALGLMAKRMNLLISSCTSSRTDVEELDVSAPNGVIDDDRDRMWKETITGGSEAQKKTKQKRDALGADGVFMTFDTVNQVLQVHRIQVKIAAKQSALNKVIERFNASEKIAREHYIRRYQITDDAKIKISLWLATTCDVSPDQKSKLDAANIGVWQRTELCKIWPTDVRNMNVRFKCPRGCTHCRAPVIPNPPIETPGQLEQR